jgi:hypothetical protein
MFTITIIAVALVVSLALVLLAVRFADLKKVLLRANLGRASFELSAERDRRRNEKLEKSSGENAKIKGINKVEQ